MSGAVIEVEVRNRQRARRVDLPRLRSVTSVLLEEELGLRHASLGVTLLGSRAMATMNWRWLKHEGSTDILTFDHRADTGSNAGELPMDLHGELFISVPDAVAQAREFGVAPSMELVRYVVHGVLHLRGYDDLEPALRRVMKREENRLVRRLAARCPVLRLLGGSS